MRITWSPRAKRKVSEYGEYIAQDNPEAASDWIEGILDEVERLKDFPEQGRKVPEVKRADVREIFSRAIGLSITLSQNVLSF
jgi:toxin ParE1/3/4